METREPEKQKELAAQKSTLELIGQITGSISHDLNNSLSVVSGYSELLLSRPIGEDLRQVMEIILDSARKAVSVSDKLLSFSRRLRSNYQTFDLNTLIVDTIRLMNRRCEQDNILLSEDLSLDSPQVEGHVGLLQQVVLQLIQNSRETVRREAAGGIIQVRTALAGLWATIEIEDDGPDILPRLDEQTFTLPYMAQNNERSTRLCFARSIVEDHGGSLKIGRTDGNAFLIVQLPAADNP